MSRKQKAGYIYLLKDTQGRIKVGVSTQPFDRFQTLRIGSPRLEFYGVIKSSLVYECERVLHSKLQELHVGGEWFYPEQPVLGITLRFIVEDGSNYGVHQILMYPNPDKLKNWGVA